MNNTVLKTISKSATEVRKDWSDTIDTVAHRKPVFIQRTHDNLVILNVSLLQTMFQDMQITVNLFSEEDGSVTGSVEELDVIENGTDQTDCLNKIIAGLKEYADDYYNEFEVWSAAPNRKAHIPYVFKILTSSDEQIRSSLVCRAGKN